MNQAQVLVVEDDNSIRHLLHEYLEAEGYRVYEAVNGRQALVLLHRHPEGLVVLLDIRMPQDGLAVLWEAALEAPPATKHAYIVMSAATPAVPEQARPLLQRLEVQEVPKPFDVKTLEAAIRTATRRLAHAD